MSFAVKPPTTTTTNAGHTNTLVTSNPVADPPPELRLARARALGGGPLAVAESCTGGRVSARITSVPGSSAYFDRGLVVYANGAKTDLLGVDPGLLAREGAVSEACARAMVDGLFQRSSARLAAAVTGIAGPSGGSPEKPVGTVWLAWGRRGAVDTERLRLDGDRKAIQAAAAEAVLQRLAEAVER